MVKNMKLLKNNEGALSTFVFILFGIIVIGHLLGYTSLFMKWASGDSSIGSIISNITADPNKMFSIITTAILAVAVPATIIGFFGGIQYLSYLIPIGLLGIFLNIFIFPIADISSELSFTSPFFPGSLFLMAFFNLFYIISVLEYIRSGIV